MGIEQWISVVAILSSIIISYTVTSWTLKKQIKREKDEGVIILYELIKRYTISCLNCIDKETSSIINDPIIAKRHLRVIKRVEQDMLELQNNPYYISILKKYPTISMLQIQLSAEIVAHENSSDFKLNQGTITKFHELNQIIQPDIQLMFKENNEFDNINSAISNLLLNNKSKHLSGAGV